MADFTHRAGTTTVAALVGILMVVSAAQEIAPGWARDLGLDTLNLPAAAADFREGRAKMGQLETACDDLTHRVAASESVVEDLAAGRLSLPAAVDELDRINTGRLGIDFAQMLALTHPDAPTYRDRVVRYIQLKLRTRMANDPARLRAALARIDAEYHASPGETE